MSNAVKINDMTKIVKPDFGETFQVEYFQHGAYLLYVKKYEISSTIDANVVFSHRYHNNERNTSKELNTDTAHMVDTFLSNPIWVNLDHDTIVNSVEVNLSSFNGTLDEIRRRIQQTLEAVEAAEEFNKVLEQY